MVCCKAANSCSKDLCIHNASFAAAINPFLERVEYNGTVYAGRENTVAAVCQARLSASPSLANVAASIAPDLSTLSRNGLIAAANEALWIQRSLEREVAALQQTMLSMQNQRSEEHTSELQSRP